MANRNEVYEAIDRERDYQDNKYPVVHGFSASPEGFLMVVEELVNQARAALVTQGQIPPLGNGDLARDWLRKIGATCVRGMEQHGIVKRE